MTFIEERASVYASKLPIWKVTKIGGKLGIECPRSDCKQKCLVARTWLTSRRAFVGRSCTYCFQTNQIPEEFRK